MERSEEKALERGSPPFGAPIGDGGGDGGGGSGGGGGSPASEAQHIAPRQSRRIEAAVAAAAAAAGDVTAVDGGGAPLAGSPPDVFLEQHADSNVRPRSTCFLSEHPNPSLPHRATGWRRAVCIRRTAAALPSPTSAPPPN